MIILIALILLNVLTCIPVHGIHNHETIFTNIYTNAVWGKNDQGEGFSGGGSLLENCSQYIKCLENFIKQSNITSIIDAGC